MFLYMMNVIINKAFKNVTFIKERIGQPSLIYYVEISANEQTKHQLYINRSAISSHSIHKATENIKVLCIGIHLNEHKDNTL